MGYIARILNYDFVPATKKITLRDVAIVDITKIQYIINVTRGVTLYDYTSPTPISVNGTNIVTISHSTAGMLYTDELDITYDFPIATGGGAAGTLSAGTNTLSLGQAVFSNANGVSFGMTGQTITASVGSAGGVNFSAGTTSDILTNIRFQNSNNVSFGLNGSTITASVSALSTQSNQALSGSNGSFTFQTATFGDLNGLSFYTSNGSLVGSYTQSTHSHSSLVFSNDNNITFGIAGSTITASASYTVPTVTNSSWTASAGTASGTISQLVFSNSNGVSFGLDNGTITATVRTDYLTTAMQSDGGSNFVNTSAGLNLTNISATLGSNSISLSVAAQSAQPVAYSAGNGSAAFSTLSFADSNGVTFSTGTQGIYATVKTDYQTSGAYLTTAALSQDSSKYVGTNGAITGGSLTVNTSGISINLPAYLTTAMASNAGSDFVQATAAFAGTNASGTIASNGISISVGSQSAQPVAASASNGSFAFSTLRFVESNGVTWATSTDGIRASVKTDYLTTAMASNRGSDFIGTNTAITQNGVSMTANSSGLSLNFPAFLTTAMQSASSSNFAGTGSAITNGTMTYGTGGLSLNLSNHLTTAMLSNAGSDFVNATAAFAGTNASGTIASNGISISVNAGGGGAAIKGSGTYTQNTGTIEFANSNGITFGLSNNGTMTASHNGITTQTNQTVGLYALGNTTQNSSSTLDARSLSYNGLGAMSVGYSNGSIQLSAPATSSLSGTGHVSISVNGSTVSIGAPSPAISGSNGSFSYSTATFGNLNGLSFYTSNGSMVASYNSTQFQTTGNYLTTARASTDAIGLNTALTANGVAWTVNSSGLSLNIPAFLTTAALSDHSHGNPTLALTNLTGTTASASNGFTLSLSAANPSAGGGIAAAAGSQTQTSGTLLFQNSNQITFGMSNSSVITASFNPINIGMSTNGNTAGTTGTFDGAGLQYVFAGGNNITLSQSSNGASVTLSIVGPNAGGGADLVDWDNFGVIQTMNQITNLTATGVTQRPIFFPMEIGGNLTWNRGMFELSKVTNSQDYAFTYNFGIYSFANSTSINLIASLQNVYNISSASSVSATGIRRFAFSGIGTAGSTLSPGHYVGMMAFSAAATSGMNASLRGGVTANPPLGLIGAGTNALSTANLSSIYLKQFRGLYTTTSNVAPAAVALSHVQGWTTAAQPYVFLQST